MVIKQDKGCLEFGKEIIVAGVLNVTPDSFYDGGKNSDLGSALSHARRMIEDGADIIDIGGESTRPDSSYVSADEEKLRVIPVIKELSKETHIPISIDTYKAEVAEEAIKAGAQIINDISGLQADDEMARVAAENNTPIIIMHIKGHPHDFPKDPVYDNLIPEIISFFERRIEDAVNSGIAHNNIIIDPGIGFGKKPEHNLAILRQLNDFKCLNLPIMVGTSRKSFISNVLELSDEQNFPKSNARLAGTLVTLIIAVINGASIVRVHDVREAVQAIKMYRAIESAKCEEKT
ncbi:MAG: dihydropteroate synthase [Candidatus Scalindua sp.]|nr:dihydropteroate synthase [Candidatus Scalindua sp.]